MSSQNPCHMLCESVRSGSDIYGSEFFRAIVVADLKKKHKTFLQWLSTPPPHSRQVPEATVADLHSSLM